MHCFGLVRQRPLQNGEELCNIVFLSLRRFSVDSFPASVAVDGSSKIRIRLLVVYLKSSHKRRNMRKLLSWCCFEDIIQKIKDMRLHTKTIHDNFCFWSFITFCFNELFPLCSRDDHSCDFCCRIWRLEALLLRRGKTQGGRDWGHGAPVEQRAIRKTVQTFNIWVMLVTFQRGLLNFWRCILPETNGLPLKMDGWNTTFLLGWLFSGLFSGATLVSGRVVVIVVVCASRSFLMFFAINGNPWTFEKKKQTHQQKNVIRKGGELFYTNHGNLRKPDPPNPTFTSQEIAGLIQGHPKNRPNVECLSSGVTVTPFTIPKTEVTDTGPNCRYFTYSHARTWCIEDVKS